MITRQDVAQRLTDYLHHPTTLVGIVDWAEQSMMEGEFEEDNFEDVRDIISQLGLADVAAFGLTWEDCQEFLSRLGYQARVEVLEVA